MGAIKKIKVKKVKVKEVGQQCLYLNNSRFIVLVTVIVIFVVIATSELLQTCFRFVTLMLLINED